MSRLSYQQILALVEIKFLRPYAYQANGVWNYYNLYRPTVEALLNKNLVKIDRLEGRDGRVRLTEKGRQALLEEMAKE